MPGLAPPPDALLYVIFQWVVFCAALVGIVLLARILVIDPLRAFFRRRATRRTHDPSSEATPTKGNKLGA